MKHPQLDEPLNIPNIDDADPDELVRLDETFTKLAYICRLALQSRQARKEGYIEDALGIERKAQAIYDTLPQNAKW